jgi:cysteine-rich repeat protein
MRILLSFSLLGLLGCGPEFPDEFCGDGEVNAELNEECDDGNLNGDDECRLDCTIPVCGDEIIDEAQGEECDDGNDDNTDSCLDNCIENICGDGILSFFEECDDGDGCSAACFDE